MARPAQDRDLPAGFGFVPKVERVVPVGERVLMAVKPSPLMIVLRSLGVSLILSVVALVVMLALASLGHPGLSSKILVFTAAIIVVRINLDALSWMTRLYVLTDRRVIRVVGVLNQRFDELPLERISLVRLDRSLRERLFGLGTLGLATAATGGTEMVWFMIAQPRVALEACRAAARGMQEMIREGRSA